MAQRVLHQLVIVDRPVKIVIVAATVTSGRRRSMQAIPSGAQQVVTSAGIHTSGGKDVYFRDGRDAGALAEGIMQGTVAFVAKADVLLIPRYR